MEEREEARLKESREEGAGRRYEELKHRAAETRDQISQKISGTAATVKERGRSAARQVGHKSRDAGTAVYGTVRENVFPTILIGLGAAGVTAGILRRRAKHEAEPVEPVGAPPEPATEPVTEERTGSGARDMVERAVESSRNAGTKAKEMVTRNPWYTTGALTVIGSLAGLALVMRRRKKGM
jgi:ElaB/YqjD/DUF883 family membrane-anchored ribosome-binding protein